jgi:hypothetical protein
VASGRNSAAILPGMHHALSPLASSSPTTVTCGSLPAEAPSVRRRVVTTGERLAHLEGRVVEHSQMFVGLRETIAHFEARVDRRFEQMDTRFLSLEGRLTALDQKIDTKVDTLGARIDALDQKLGASIDALDQKLDAKIGAFDQKLDANVGAIDATPDAKIGARDMCIISTLLARFGP